jgi:Arc/MetJ-type ribon-helix-helix transcriptional regulator
MKQIQVSLPPHQVRNLKERARRDECSVSYLIRLAVDSWLQNQELQEEAMKEYCLGQLSKSYRIGHVQGGSDV